MEAALRETIIDCAPHICDGAPPIPESGPFLESIPFWAILILVILVALLIVSFLAPAAKPPDPLQKKVEDALKDYEGQASMWDDPQAAAAFRAAQGKVKGIFEGYKPGDRVRNID